MTYQHKELALGRWAQLSFLQQMANIGSEVERALNWRSKDKSDLSLKAFERALELIDLTVNDLKEISRLKEINRMREALVDFFLFSNEYNSTEALWRKYFLSFNMAARRHT